MRLFSYPRSLSFRAAHGSIKNEQNKLFKVSTYISDQLKENPLRAYAKGTFVKDAKLLICLLKAPEEIAEAAKTIAKLKNNKSRLTRMIKCLSIVRKVTHFFLKIIYYPLLSLKGSSSTSSMKKSYLLFAISLHSIKLAVKISNTPKKLRISDLAAIVLLVMTIAIFCLKLQNPSLCRGLVVTLLFFEACYKTFKIFIVDFSFFQICNQKNANELSKIQSVW